MVGDFFAYPPVGFVDVVVISKDEMFDASLLLKPREYAMGIGCKKGISIMQIFVLSSISQKRDE